MTETIPTISAKGFKVGDRVNWDDQYNCCRWGKCEGVVMISTDEDTPGEMVVFWYKTCTRHPGHYRTESDNIDEPHVKVRFI